MAKFSGKAGFATKVETKPGVFTTKIEERVVKGDLLNEVKRYGESQKMNDDLSVTNRISILADKYTNQNKEKMIYVVMDGVPWKISTIEIQRPRLILNIGSVWNGKRP